MGTDALKAAATGTATERRKTIIDLLGDQKVVSGMRAVATKHLTGDRLLKLAVNAVHKTPLLLQCDPKTVLGAFMASAALGLEPNTVQQQAFLIPYKRRAKINNQWVDVYDCQFQIGARGFITLAYRSPRIRQIVAEAIHEDDRFDHQLGSGAFLRYAKALRDRGALIGSFCYVAFDNGTESACVLPLDELYKIRARSETYRALTRAIVEAENDKDRAKAEGKLAETPWVMWEDDMAAKSAIKKHAKQLPLAAGDTLLAGAALDNASEGGTIDLSALADVDATRAVVGEGMDPPEKAADQPEGQPALENQASQVAPFQAQQQAKSAAQQAQAPAAVSPQPKQRGAAPAPAEAVRQKRPDEPDGDPLDRVFDKP